MKTTASAVCTFPGCKERGHYSYDTQKECREHYVHRQKYRCARHTNPDNVLSSDNTFRRTVMTAIKRDSGIYWEGDGFGHGLITGIGHKAFSKDFPEGTQLIITAEVVIPTS